MNTNAGTYQLIPVLFFTPVAVGAGCNLQFAYQNIPTIAEMCQLRRENDRLRAALAPGTAWCAWYCSPALKFCAGSFRLRYNPLLWE